MKKTNAKLSINRTFFKEIPQLELIASTKENDEDQYEYYLSPFRAYGFQVSGSDEGDGAYGVSEFIGLKNIVRTNNRRMAIVIFRALALNAIMDHSRHYESSYYPSFKEFKIFDEFIDASYDWVKSIVDEENERIKREEFSKIKLKQEEKEPGIMDGIKTKVLDIKSKVWNKQA